MKLLTERVGIAAKLTRAQEMPSSYLGRDADYHGWYDLTLAAKFEIVP
jgi:hypothetical protein